MKLNKEKFKERISYWQDRYYTSCIAAAETKAGAKQTCETVSRALMDAIWNSWKASEETVNKKKRRKLNYLSAEFLMGRALGNNLINLGLLDEVSQILNEMGLDINAAEDAEPDAALGNGGLGRLAACFIESLATLNLPARGYGIRYKYGMFRQEIQNGRQVEVPDDWSSDSDPWSVRREHCAVTVRFGGRVATETGPDGSLKFKLVDTNDVLAVPYDMPVIGWGAKTINTLRLWQSEAPDGFDFQLFNNMEYLRAVEKRNSAENITTVLYPNDSGIPGKLLRLRQQYFFTSASLQDIIREYKYVHGPNLVNLPSKAVMQLNDTHPVIAIPELMRILLDEEGFEWVDAWKVVSQCFAYTNHTVLNEALEKWPVEHFRTEFPRLIQIIEEINRRFMTELNREFPEDRDKLRRMSIFSEGMIKMAHLAIVAAFSVNGVAALHTEILKTRTLKDWYSLWPDKFNNKTNGVTQRRWLKKANPGLAAFLDELIGPEWISNLSLLNGLKTYADNTAVTRKLGEIKAENKAVLAQLVQKLTGITVNPSSLFDVQIKRLHEYKRQLLNILSVIHDWQMLKDSPNSTIPPRTVFFGAKAASGYRRAKQIIHLINAVANRINNDKATVDMLKVVFIPDYKVSTAEVLFPGAEISQQISTAGKEASGTGNMKFMMNGAMVLGTMDGANIEIVEEIGQENAFIFGLSADETASLYASGGTNPYAILEMEPLLKRAIDTLVDGTFGLVDDFREIYDSLVYGMDGALPDEYFVLTDFASYRDARENAGKTWVAADKWNRMSLLNIAGSGRFSSDRTILEYSSDIWKLKPLY